MDVDKEIDALELAGVWDRDGELIRPTAVLWITDFIRRVRADTLAIRPPIRQRVACEGCSTHIYVYRGHFPDGWQQHGESRFKGTTVGSWCPDCVKK